MRRCSASTSGLSASASSARSRVSGERARDRADEPDRDREHRERRSRAGSPSADRGRCAAVRRRSQPLESGSTRRSEGPSCRSPRRYRTSDDRRVRGRSAHIAAPAAVRLSVRSALAIVVAVRAHRACCSRSRCDARARHRVGACGDRGRRARATRWSSSAHALHAARSSWCCSWSSCCLGAIGFVGYRIVNDVTRGDRSASRRPRRSGRPSSRRTRSCSGQIKPSRSASNELRRHHPGTAARAGRPPRRSSRRRRAASRSSPASSSRSSSCSTDRGCSTARFDQIRDPRAARRVERVVAPRHAARARLRAGQGARSASSRRARVRDRARRRRARARRARRVGRRSGAPAGRGRVHRRAADRGVRGRAARRRRAVVVALAFVAIGIAEYVVNGIVERGRSSRVVPDRARRRSAGSSSTASPARCSCVLGDRSVSPSSARSVRTKSRRCSRRSRSADEPRPRRRVISSTPRMTVLADENQPPVPFTQRELARSRPGGRAASPRSCRTASTSRNMPRMPGWQCDSPPPSVLVGSAPPSAQLAVLDERAALALLAEAEPLERQQHHRA